MAVGSLLFAVFSFLLGAVPFGRLIGRAVARIDITQRGSRNIGATNVARELGIKWGLLTLLLDTLKGFLPVILCSYYLPRSGAGRELWLSIVGLSALGGHQFSPFLGFQGGKGVATALGVFLALSPVACLLALPLFLFAVYRWDFISLASMVSVSALPIILALLGRPAPVVIAAVAAAGLICYRHRENIDRLLKGEERRWRKGKAQPNRSRSLSNSSSE
jgi:glycerol-3-phosphate acyltransferase PlsY